MLDCSPTIFQWQVPAGAFPSSCSQPEYTSLSNHQRKECSKLLPLYHLIFPKFLIFHTLFYTNITRDCPLPEACWTHFKKRSLGFSGSAVVESLPANAGDTGSSPGPGRSHMPRRNWAREPQLLSLRVWSLCSATREAATVRGPRTVMKSGPCLPQLEKALAQKRRPNTAKNK